MRKIIKHPPAQKPPASGRPPVLRISQRDVQDSTDELVRFHRFFTPFSNGVNNANGHSFISAVN